jgi:hypothetical protein
MIAEVALRNSRERERPERLGKVTNAVLSETIASLQRGFRSFNHRSGQDDIEGNPSAGVRKSPIAA